MGVSMSYRVTIKNGILNHVELEGSQQQEFRQTVDGRDEDGVGVESHPVVSSSLITES